MGQNIYELMFSYADQNYTAKHLYDKGVDSIVFNSDYFDQNFGPNLDKIEPNRKLTRGEILTIELLKYSEIAKLRAIYNLLEKKGDDDTFREKFKNKMLTTGILFQESQKIYENNNDIWIEEEVQTPVSLWWSPNSGQFFFSKMGTSASSEYTLIDGCLTYQEGSIFLSLLKDKKEGLNVNSIFYALIKFKDIIIDDGVVETSSMDLIEDNIPSWVDYILSDKEQQQKQLYEQQLIELLKTSTIGFENIPAEWQTERICQAAVSVDFRNYKHIPNERKNNKLFSLVTKELHYPQSYIDDGKIYLDQQLVEFILIHYKGSLLDTPDIFINKNCCLIAANLHKGNVIQSVPVNLRTEEIILSCINSNLTNIDAFLEHVPDKHKSRVFWLKLCRNSGVALKFVPENFRNLLLCATAYAQNEEARDYIPEHLQEEACQKDICKKMYLFALAEGYLEYESNTFYFDSFKNEIQEILLMKETVRCKLKDCTLSDDKEESLVKNYYFKRDNLSTIIGCHLAQEIMLENKLSRTDRRILEKGIEWVDKLLYFSKKDAWQINSLELPQLYRLIQEKANEYDLTNNQNHGENINWNRKIYNPDDDFELAQNEYFFLQELAEYSKEYETADQMPSEIISYALSKLEDSKFKKQELGDNLHKLWKADPEKLKGIHRIGASLMFQEATNKLEIFETYLQNYCAGKIKLPKAALIQRNIEKNVSSEKMRLITITDTFNRIYKIFPSKNIPNWVLEKCIIKE